MAGPGCTLDIPCIDKTISGSESVENKSADESIRKAAIIYSCLNMKTVFPVQFVT